MNNWFCHTQSKKNLLAFCIILLGFLSLILLFGCTEMTRAQKNLCYSLTSQSYSYVPVCETEKSCFDKVNEMFNTNLGYQTESDLYELKNHVGRSWFFYNKAVKEMKVLQGLCSKGSAQSLGGEINQVQFYIGTAFLELDLAMKNSFNVISSEEQRLSGEKLDLAKEEVLYDSLVELRQIISELSSGATNSDSYVSYYMQKAAAFSKSAGSKTSVELVEKTTFWVDSTAYVNGTVLKDIGIGDEAHFPFIEDISQNTFAYLENLFYTKQNILALQNFPASEFMKLYSDLGGNNNSALKRFTNLQNKTSSNLVAAKNSTTALWVDLDKKQSTCKTLLSANITLPKFDSLALTLLKSQIMTVDLNAKSDCFVAKSILLKEKKSRGELSLGEELSEVKMLTNSLIQSINNLEFKNTEYFGLLSSECDKKANEVKAVNQKDLQETIDTFLSDAKFYASKTLNSTGDDKLNYCTLLLEKFNSFEQGLKDYSVLDAKVKDNTKQCVTYLESVLTNSDLGELKLRFDELKSKEVTKENLLWFSSYCESIKTQVDFAFRDKSDIKDLENSFAEFKKGFAELLRAAAYFTDADTTSILAQMREKISNYEKYFDEEHAILDKVLPVKEFLISGIKE
ncbi:MAG: hypothetical protein WCI04_02910, partial [archaeon]